MKKIHLICNAHIDPIWQWSWDEGISSVIATFKSAINLSKQFDYIFCHGESLLYEAIERYAPDIFNDIKRLVKEGKWKITGGWYLQPDCNMPSGESIARQIEVGQEYFMRKFGVLPEIATNYDSFGHSVGLVQIMVKYGYKGYIHFRPIRKENQFAYPNGKFYKWTSPDGSSLICTDTGSYNSALGKVTEKIFGEIKDLEEVDYILWGVGNHGGGPSRKDLNDIKELKLDGTELIHSYPEALFSDNIKITGEIKRSITPAMPGCYSSMAKVKRAHRETENLYYATEKMLSIASLNGMGYNEEELLKAEKQLLLAEFHDILPGSSAKAGEDEGLELLSSSRKILKDLRTKAFLYLTINEPVAENGEYPIFVFNYMPYEVVVPIEAEFMLADQNWDIEKIYKPYVYYDGVEIPCQQIKEESTINIDWRKKIVFVGKLKPMGITRFSVKTVFEKAECKKFGDVEKFDDLGINLLMYEDSADPWAMSNEELHQVGKNSRPFRLMNDKEIKDFCAIEKELKPIHVIEDGVIYTSYEKFVKYGNTNAVIEYKEYKNLPYIDLKVTVEFSEKNKLVRLKLPVPKGKVIGDGPFITEEKVDGEFTFQKWVGIQQENGQIYSIINDGIYGGKVEDGDICLTLLRGSGYCIHPVGRELYPQDRYLPRIDSGRYEYNFRLFQGDLYEVTKMAELFNQKPYAINLFPIGGERKDVSIKMSDNAILSSIQKSDNGYKLRVFNPTDTDKKVQIKVKEKEYQMKVNKYKFESVEIKA